MLLSRLAVVWSLSLALSACSLVNAEPPAADSGPFADGKVIQTPHSGTIASRMLQKTAFAQPTGQIKFDIQIISVDSKTRDEIYASLKDLEVKTEITRADDKINKQVAETSPAGLSSRHTMSTGSLISTTVIDQERVESLYETAKQGKHFKVVARPQVVAADGQVAALQQQVQRPFMAVLEKVQVGEQEAVQSGIQVLSEGTDIVVQGGFDADSLYVNTKILQSRVASVETHHVYGIGEGRHMVQVPSYEVREAVATGKLRPNQTLLIDPYFQSTVNNSINKTTEDSSLLSKFPYVQVAFEERAEPQDTPIQVHTLVLLRARKLAAKSTEHDSK